MGGVFRAVAVRCRVAGSGQAVVSEVGKVVMAVAEDGAIGSFGNLYARINAEGSGPTLMISAHSDEIGALVKSIEPSGMLRIERVGGLIETLAIGRHVRVRGHRGVIGVKAGHIQTCLLYTSPSPRARTSSRMPSSA